MTLDGMIDARLQAAALASVSNAVVITDGDGHIVWVNAAFTAMSGYTAVEAVGHTPRLLKSGVQDERFYADLWDTIRAGRPWRGEVVNRHKDGHLYTVLQTITPITDAGDGRPYFVAVHEDVTPLRTYEARLQALFDHALDAILLFDDDGGLVDANPAVCTLTGYDVTELATMTLGDVVPASHQADFREAWSRFIAEGHARGSYPVRRKDGEVVEVDYQAVAGITPGVNLLIARDITALRRAEQEREEALRRLVGAQEAERARIGAEIHDDSVQVMTAVGLRLEALTSQVRDPETLAMLQRLQHEVRESVQRLRTLMFALRPPELDRDGLGAALRLFLETTATRAHLRWQLVDTSPHELADETRVVLYRIAQEAITNARKHAAASLLEIMLDRVGDGVRLRVRDDGRGFSPAELADARPHHIGTRVMAERAETAGGRFRIHSAAGEGTTVEAWLPASAG